MKIISLNIWNGGTLWEEMIAFLQAESPDIILMQEVWKFDDATVYERSLKGLLETLAYPHSAFAPAFRHNSDIFHGIEEGYLILSRFPIAQHQYNFYYREYTERTAETPEQFRHTPCLLQHAIIDAPGKTLNIFNTHGVWELHGNDTPDRLSMGKYIAEAVDGKNHVVLGGDCNVLPGTETITIIEEKLRNVLKGESATTFNMQRKDNPGYATAAVDMLFVSDDMKVTKKKVYDVDVSDHLPIMIEVES